ncbi:MAG: tRNA pseudouridine(38-40) synthase TruA [Candidatus Methylumidiphilus sp.]|nr:tRNA pseudouridine(38-40) synthase TruA [Pseudomonadota bacterium]
MPRIALGLEYDGSDFVGWQWQTGQRNVQACVEEAVSKVAAEPVTVHCAGRTDAGVHALEQVIHFDTHTHRECRSWLMGANANLPDDVRVLWAKEVGPGFHARYSAVARYYRYVILNRPMKSALYRKQVTWCFYPLDESKMQEAANHLLGHHDFSSFRAQGCQSKSPSRIMHFIRVRRENERVIIDLSANAFLHHMVRNIAGVLMEIGTGKKPADWTSQLLELRDRKQGGVTAPSDGLYLGGVCYPPAFGLPNDPIFDLLPPNAARHVHPGGGDGEDIR